MTKKSNLILIHLADGARQPIDPGDVYLLEAAGGETHIRTRAAERHLDVRTLGDLETLFQPFGFVRIHRSFIVNPRRIRLIRLRETESWEVKLAPPVNRVLPVSRDRSAHLWAAFGE
jgi:DNA-binding LytR/AlgR family response regulator